MSELNLLLLLLSSLILSFPPFLLFRIILSHYLSRTGSECALSAAITISTPLHPASSQFSLENKWFNRKLYIDMLVNNMMKIVKRYDMADCHVMAASVSSHISISYLALKFFSVLHFSQ